MATFLRFSRSEYQAIAALCRSLNLERCTPHILRQVLFHSLIKMMPSLARRIRDFSGQQLRILHEHLREQHRPSIRSRFTADEFGLLVEAFGSLLFNLRFVRPLKKALVEHFQVILPVLATKLERLSSSEFEELCEQVQQRVRRKL